MGLISEDFFYILIEKEKKGGIFWQLQRVNTRGNSINSVSGLNGEREKEKH